jgi:flagellar assembly protein FliH
MPLSPEVIAPSASLMQLAELGNTELSVTEVRSAVSANSRTAALAPLFEIAQSSGIPEGVLAPARDAAQAAGYTAGWASGARAARAVADTAAGASRTESERLSALLRDRLHATFAAIDKAADALEQRAVPAAEQLEDVIVSAALAIAEQLVGHSLRNDPDRAPATLARVLALVPANEDVAIRLSAEDHAILTADDPDSLEPSGAVRSIRLVQDASLQPGDAIATSGATVIDARISVGLARVREVLAR